MIDSAIQAAIYSALTSDGTLSAAVTGIYDYVPPNTDYPYVTIGEETNEPWDTLGRLGVESEVTIRVWSQYRGNKEAKDISDLVYNVLHNGSLTISGMTHVSTRFSGSTLFVDDDNFTRQILLDFRTLAHG